MATLTCYCGIMMPLRDGVRLSTDVYLPDKTGRFPVIVIRSPYWGTNSRSQDALEFCRQGIGMVIQDCRGTGNSEGIARLWHQEKEDGEDFLNWIAEQEWFNGNLVGNGESYPGGTQLQEARAANPVMKGMTPHFAPTNIAKTSSFVGGAKALGLCCIWTLGMLNVRRNAGLEINSSICTKLPLKDLTRLAGFNEDWPLLNTWNAHSSYDDYWKEVDAEQDIPKMIAPAYVTGGWFDIFIPQTLSGFQLLREKSNSEKVRKFTRCVIEPLDHSGQTGDVDYGDNHLLGIIALRNRFMKNILLNPEEDPLPDQPPLRLFLMGSNRWIESDSWPLPGTEYTNLYLHSGGSANSSSGDGMLDWNAPAGGETPDKFDYDPMKPVPTNGGNNMYFPAGQREQSEIEKRSDVLVYTSGVLPDDLHVIGWIKAVIYASSSAVDTDFTVKLVDVYPDGKAYNVCDGIQRARFRKSLEREEFLTPGEPAEFTVDCWATGITFLKGHRIRIEVSSSNFPRFDRNQNTGHPIGEDAEMAVAHQSVYHSKEYPSHVILPVLPPEKL